MAYPEVMASIRTKQVAQEMLLVKEAYVHELKASGNHVPQQENKRKEDTMPFGINLFNEKPSYTLRAQACASATFSLSLLPDLFIGLPSV